MKKIIYCSMTVFSVLIFVACDRKPNDTQATEKKQGEPVIELREEVQVPKSDTTLIQKDSTERR